MRRARSLRIQRRHSSVMGIRRRAASRRIAFQSDSGMKMEICLRSSVGIGDSGDRDRREQAGSAAFGRTARRGQESGVSELVGDLPGD